MIETSWTWRKFTDRTLKVIQLHSHSSLEFACQTCHHGGLLPNGTLCFVTITEDDLDIAKKVTLKCSNDNLNFVLEDKPKNFLYSNKINIQPSIQSPFVKGVPFSKSKLNHPRPPIPFRNSGTDCFVICVVNTLFNLEFVKDLINSSTHPHQPLLTELKRLARTKKGVMSVQPIRDLASQYNRDFITGQQDSSLLLQALIAICDPMQSKFLNNVMKLDTCSNCGKQTPNAYVKHDLVLDVYLESFKAMVTEACRQKTSQITRRCSAPQCKNVPGNLEKEEGIQHTSTDTIIFDADILVLKANIFLHYGQDQNYQEHKIMTKLYPDSIIKIPDQERFYKLKSVITHKGDSLR